MRRINPQRVGEVIATKIDGPCQGGRRDQGKKNYGSHEVKPSAELYQVPGAQGLDVLGAGRKRDRRNSARIAAVWRRSLAFDFSGRTDESSGKARISRLDQLRGL